MKVLSSIELSIVSCEIFGLITMLSIFFYLNRHRKTLSKSSKVFLYSVFALCIGIVCDVISYVFDGNSQLVGLLYLTNYLAVVLADLISIIFITYIYSVACISDTKVTKFGLYVIGTISVIDFIFETYGILAGKTIWAGQDTIFEFNLIFFLITQTLCAITGIIYIVVNKKALNLHYTLSFTIYYIVPLLAMLVAYLCNEYLYVYTATAISYTIVYVEIESRKERILINKIRLDPLTKLLNRSAFNERLKEISSSKEVRNVGIIFCDINGLKQINDNEGHKAGDEYIIKFANLLTSNFRESGVFRLSGDEFIIILNSINLNEFENRLTKFISVLKENDNIASAGGSYGGVEFVDSLIDEAEKNMYIEKTDYYKKKN